MPIGISSKPINNTPGSRTYIINPRYVLPECVTDVIIKRNTIIEKVISAIVAPTREIQFFEESGSFSFIHLPFYFRLEIKERVSEKEEKRKPR